MLERKSDLSLLQITKSYLIDAYSSGELAFLSKVSQGALELETIERGSSRLLDTFDEQQQREAIRKHSYVKLAVKKFGTEISVSQCKLYMDLFAERLKDPTPPSAISLYRWWRAWSESGGDICSLINRTGGRNSKYLQEYRELIFEVVDEVLMRPEYGTKQDAYDLFKFRLKELNSFRLVLLPVPSQATFYRLLNDLIDPYELKKAQQGKQAADMAFRVSGKGVTSSRILERVEIDHTPIDLIVIDEATGEAIGRPSLTGLIDHYSRMPLGFYLGFEPPSGVSVMRAIRHAILPKSYVNDDYPDFKNDWPAFGIFTLLVCDNGSEFHDHQLKRIAYELNTELFYCPKKKPYYKGTIERFLGTLNKAICHSAPGTTRSNINARGKYNSEREASIGLEELRRFIHDWIINIYNHEFHEDLGDSPFNVWMQGLKHVEPILPASRDSLDMTLTKEFQRSINHQGVSVLNLKYNSDELGLLRRQLKGNRKVKVRVDPENLEKVWVFDEQADSFFLVPCQSSRYVEGLSARQHDHINKRRKDRRKALDTDELLEEKVRFKQAVRNAAKSKSIRKKTKAAQLSQIPIIYGATDLATKSAAKVAPLNLDDLDGFEMDWSESNG